MTAAAVAGWMRLRMNFGIADISACTCGSSSMPCWIMPVSMSEKYAVMAVAPWLASSTASARPACSTAALLIAYGIAPAPLR